MANSLNSMPDQIINLILVMVLVSALLGSLGTVFYTQWSAVNTSAMGGDTSTQSIWDLVPTLFWIIIPLSVLLIVYGIVKGKLSKGRR